MADKEAIVYIVDVAKSMGEARGGREESDLDWCMRYVWDKITTTVSAKISSRGMLSDERNPGFDGAQDAAYWRRWPQD